MDKPAATAAAASDDARKRLATMLNQIVDEAEHLLSTAQRSGGEQFDIARDKFESQVKRARAELDDLGESAAYQARHAARAADQAVREHPYAAIGIAAGIGVLLGALLSRR